MIAGIALAMTLFAAAPAAAEPAPVPSAEPAPVPAAGEAAATQKPERDLARIEAYLNSIRSLDADFVQETSDGQVAHGRLMLERPGRLRFEYSDGTPLLLVSNGRILTFIDYSVGQVTRWPIDDTPLGLLVRDHIDLAAAGAVFNAVALAGGRRLLVTVRDAAHPERGLLTLSFLERPGGLRLEGWEVVDAQGTVTRIRLENLRLDAVLADALWSFDDPRKLPSQRRRRRR